MTDTTATDGQRPAAPDALPKPDGVDSQEWGALGDPGKRALTRERAAREQAERDLAAARSAQRLGMDQQQPPTMEDITAAIEAAIEPLRQAEVQRAEREHRQQVADSVRAAAGERLHDAADAITHLDLSTLATDGKPDDQKIAAALDDLVKRKPYLAKPVDTRRRYDPSQPLGGAPAAVDLDKQVSDAVTRMADAVGIRVATD